MLNQKSKQIIIVLLIVVVAIMGFNYYLSFKKLTINFNNVSKVEVYETGQNQNNSLNTEDKLVGTVAISGDSMKLRPGNYLVKFTGDTDYENTSKPITIAKGNKVMSYEPYYSEDKLRSLRQLEESAIKQAILAAYPLANQYEIQEGKMLHFGEWYATTLVYKGKDFFNADKLRLVAYKEVGKWKVMTNPPTISLNKFKHNEIPKDILDETNLMQ